MCSSQNLAMELRTAPASRTRAEQKRLPPYCPSGDCRQVGRRASQTFQLVLKTSFAFFSSSPLLSRQTHITVRPRSHSSSLILSPWTLECANAATEAFVKIFLQGIHYFDHSEYILFPPCVTLLLTCLADHDYLRYVHMHPLLFSSSSHGTPILLCCSPACPSGSMHHVCCDAATCHIFRLRTGRSRFNNTITHPYAPCMFLYHTPTARPTFTPHSHMRMVHIPWLMLITSCINAVETPADHEMQLPSPLLLPPPPTPLSPDSQHPPHRPRTSTP